MKKTITIIVVILTLTAAITGCVQQTNVMPEVSEQTEEQTATLVPTPDPTPEPTEPEYIFQDEDEWVYWSEGLEIYKIKGNEIIRLNTVGEPINFIAVVNDWIYYSALVYGDGPGDDLHWRVYKMKTDGTKNTEIKKLRRTENHYISEGWVYYSEGKPWNSQKAALYKCRLDGTKKTLLRKMSDYHVDIEDIVVANGWVYFTTFDSENNDNSKICKISTKGKNTKVIYELTWWTFITLYEDWLYFYEDGQFKKVNVNSGKVQMVLDDVDTQRMLISDGWIYFIGDYNMDKQGGYIYRVRTDSTEKTKLSDDLTRHMSLFKDTIYYSAGDAGTEWYEWHYLYKIRIDGKGRRMIGVLE